MSLAAAAVTMTRRLSQVTLTDEVRGVSVHRLMPGVAVRSEIFEFGPFRLHADRRLLLKHDQPIRLGSRAFDILLALGRSIEAIPARVYYFVAERKNSVTPENMSTASKIMSCQYSIPNNAYRVFGRDEIIKTIASLLPARPHEGRSLDAPDSHFRAAVDVDAGQVGRDQPQPLG